MVVSDVRGSRNTVPCRTCERIEDDIGSFESKARGAVDVKQSRKARLNSDSVPDASPAPRKREHDVIPLPRLTMARERSTSSHTYTLPVCLINCLGKSGVSTLAIGSANHDKTTPPQAMVSLVISKCTANWLRIRIQNLFHRLYRSPDGHSQPVELSKRYQRLRHVTGRLHWHG